MAAHQKIARINHPGYCPRRWCAVCGRAATKNSAFLFCEGEADCPNVCHATCLGDREHYACTETQQLRQEAGVDVEVAYVDVTSPDHNTEAGATQPDTPSDATLPSSPPVDDDESHSIESEDERRQYMQLDKEEVVDHCLRLKQEVSKQHAIIQSLTTQRDWIIDRKPQVLEVLQLMEALSDARDADERRSTRTIGTSAIPELIDRDWGSRCTSSPSVKQWWESDLPRRLPKRRLGAPTTPNTATTSATTNTPQPTTSSAHSLNVTTTTTAASPASTPAAVPPSTQPSQHIDTNQIGTTTAPSRNAKNKKRGKLHTNSERGTAPPPASSTAQPRQPPRASLHAQPRYSPPKAHSRPTCQYCLRPGHYAETCFSRAADARQEALLRRVLAEGRLDRQPPHHNPQLPHAPFRDSDRQHQRWEEQPEYHRDWSWGGRY